MSPGLPPARDDAPVMMNPIGVFRCAARYPYDAARQPPESHGGGGVIHLQARRNLEVAARDLSGFSRIWIVYVFHHNTSWKPLVLPPRGDRKVGVFATRAPYRPNPIGLSCVELRGVDGLRIEVGQHDLLDETPVLDIKPYLPYADSFSEVATGWLEGVAPARWQVNYQPSALPQADWLESRIGEALAAFVSQQLGESPMDARRKRIRALDDGQWEIAYRTWRVRYVIDEAAHVVSVVDITTGYSPAELADQHDPYLDKGTHREFLALFADRR